MKKTFFAFVALLSFATAKAQLNVSVGPVAGFGHSWISGGENNRYKPSGNFGLQLYFSPTEHLGIGGDFKYSIEGGATEIGGVKYATRLNYLRVPITGIYFFNNYGDRLRPKISLGPSIGFLIGGNLQADGTETSFDVKDNYKNIDFGIVGNVGVHYRLITNTWITFDLNYYNGLSDITETAATNVKNRNIGVNVGLAFGIGTHRPGY